MKGTTRQVTNQKGGLLKFLRPLMIAGLPLMKIVLTALTNSILAPLGLKAAASATDTTICKKVFESETTLVFSNEEIDDIKKIVKPLRNTGLLIKAISETVENEAKNKKKDF